MEDVMSVPRLNFPDRNRAPCANCKTAKRKCDRATSLSCSRCRKHNIACIPSATARWRVESIDSTGQRLRHSYRAARTEGSVSSPVEQTATQTPSSPPCGASITPLPFTNFDLVEINVPPFPAIDEDLPPDLDPVSNSALSPSASAALPAIGDLPAELDDPYLIPAPAIAPWPTSYLWQAFVQSIAPGVSLEEEGSDNKLTQYFASRVAGTPSLFSAIIFLSHAVKTNWTTDISSHIDSTVIAAVAIAMEQEAVAHIGEAMSRHLQPPPQSSAHCITTLTTLITLCSAYIAQGNIPKLWACLQQAMEVARKGFAASVAIDESFLFLVRWLGYIHIVAMLDETGYSIDAPNYFSIAAQQGHSSLNPEAIFHDVDSFLGISQAVGDLLYRLGRIIRFQRYPSTGDTNKTDITDMEIRMQLILRKLKAYKQDGRELPSHFDHYNEALVHTALLRLLEFKQENPQSKLMQSTVAQILDSCAAVPEKSPVAKLMLFPLFWAGVHTTRPVYQSFILRRLEVLRSGCCFSNVGHLIEIIEQRWLGHKNGEHSQGTHRPLP
ncbi:fungal-specific transcription factor domain-containing protein [Aspergillus caelatus]|uniref:Fungal-specific transcription factor domain-containing protein n=1 Tax=Aspergillus caelatus TaxID=61420 RepID=A0A5N6ZRX1_9EURO|nr:fungal-specific transcription factor domain-containing protein [Aspergillus caelatus]KAE8360381.1 fungal-specific transcription factor domain-containing protein [Aspergillus caelatus]